MSTWSGLLFIDISTVGVYYSKEKAVPQVFQQAAHLLADKD
jgi:hypothetical protein